MTAVIRPPASSRIVSTDLVIRNVSFYSRPTALPLPKIASSSYQDSLCLFLNKLIVLPHLLTVSESALSVVSKCQLPISMLEIPWCDDWVCGRLCFLSPSLEVCRLSDLRGAGLRFMAAAIWTVGFVFCRFPPTLSNSYWFICAHCISPSADCVFHRPKFLLVLDFLPLILTHNAFYAF